MVVVFPYLQIVSFQDDIHNLRTNRQAGPQQGTGRRKSAGKGEWKCRLNRVVPQEHRLAAAASYILHT